MIYGCGVGGLEITSPTFWRLKRGEQSINFDDEFPQI